MKMIACREAGKDCPWSYKAEDEQEIVKAACRHLARVHHEHITPDEVDAIREFIRDVDPDNA